MHYRDKMTNKSGTLFLEFCCLIADCWLVLLMCVAGVLSSQQRSRLACWCTWWATALVSDRHQTVLQSTSTGRSWRDLGFAAHRTTCPSTARRARAGARAAPASQLRASAGAGGGGRVASRSTTSPPRCKSRRRRRLCSSRTSQTNPSAAPALVIISSFWSPASSTEINMTLEFRPILDLCETGGWSWFATFYWQVYKDIFALLILI